MLYPKNDKPFCSELFQNPSAEYRGAPFWAWNCALEKEELLRQIGCLKDMGFGGFHMHVRTGMATPYLSDTYMDLIHDCLDKAKAEAMLTWLYDEDRWPSGAAGGLVTRNPEYRARYLLFTPESYEENKVSGTAEDSSARATRTGNGVLVACYDVVLDQDGNLAAYRQIREQDPASGTKWYAYQETSNPNPWFNNQTYVDTLNPKAIQAFIQTTHERYLQTTGDDFGTAIPAIFTDEPQFSRKSTLNNADDRMDVILPWTDDLPETFEAAYAENLLAHLPELFWELPGGRVSRIRYFYHDHIAERFAAAFADQIGGWCQKHRLMLTGHMMEEPTLHSQTAALGEAMRSYRSFGLPGIDMLCDHYEFTTAKQAQSAARQYGCPGVLSELYGVTNWDFDFRGHKLQGDWQAALGITVRVPHLSWVSMAGEAKRDYPASINYQVPWYREYPLIENHFARLNTALTRGKAVCRIGVIHPVESYWLCWGPKDKTAAVREQLDHHFADLTNWLLLGQIDFDFISESLLPQQCPQAANPLPVGRMRYQVIIVPDLLQLRSTTLERLLTFRKMGGRVIFLCDAPALIDGRPDPAARALYDISERVPMAETAILSVLEPERDIDIRLSSGGRANSYVCQIRQDGQDRWVFIAKGKRPDNPDISEAENLRIRLRGSWQITELNTLDGTIGSIAAVPAEDWTLVERTMYSHDSLLMRLTPAAAAAGPALAKNESLHFKSCDVRTSDYSFTRVPVTFSEPNVLLLDIAEYALDDQAMRPAEEILRADNVLRQELGWPTRREAVAQPWTVPVEEIRHTASLRFAIDSEILVKSPKLALEDAETAAIMLNGQPVAPIVDGWYTDKSIKTVVLPDLPAGRSILELRLPFGRRTNLEWCYLLGDFTVRVAGSLKTIGAPVNELAFGDITTQGFPFYGGNLTYRLAVKTQGSDFAVHVPKYRGALVTAAVDGRRIGPVAFSPYTLTFSGVAAGEHCLELTLFGNRVNTFGCVHNCDVNWPWYGPNAWRTTGDYWSYEYHLRQTGILKAPDIIMT